MDSDHHGRYRCAYCQYQIGRHHFIGIDTLTLRPLSVCVSVCGCVCGTTASAAKAPGLSTTKVAKVRATAAEATTDGQ